jgi:hypothetical protein
MLTCALESSRNSTLGATCRRARTRTLKCTSFTGTKVQILTQLEEVAGRQRLASPRYSMELPPPNRSIDLLTARLPKDDGAEWEDLPPLLP